MNVHDDSTMKVTPETRRRHEMMTCEVMKMHQFDPNADEEKAPLRRRHLRQRTG